MKYTRQIYSKSITLNGYTVADNNVVAYVQGENANLETDMVYTFGKNKQPIYMALVGNGSVYGKVVSRGLNNWTSILDSSAAPLSRVLWDGIKWISTYSDISYITHSYDQATFSTYKVTNKYTSIGFNPRTNLYVAMGNSGIHTSYDSIHWITNTSGTALITNSNAYHNGRVLWNGAIWVAAGNGGSGVSLIYSEDGVNWYSGGANVFGSTYGAFDLVWNGTIWVACGEGGNGNDKTRVIAYSYTGKSWTQVILESKIFNGSPDYNISKPMSLEWDGISFVLTLNASVSNATTKHNMVVSADGIIWTHQEQALITSLNVGKWTGSNFVLGGQDTTSTLLFKQTEGYANWYKGHHPYTNEVYDIEANTEFHNLICFPRNIQMACGTGGNSPIMYSLDSGSTWLDTSINIGSCMTKVNDAKYNGSIWVACGSGGGNTLATSVDGLSWIGGGADIFTTEAMCVNWSQNTKLWVACGSGGNAIAYSSNGYYWIGCGTSALTAGTCVNYNGSIWVAGGTNNLAYSSNGKSWNPVSPAPLFTTKAVGVVWTGHQWIAAGDGSNNIYTSNNGIKWNLKTSLSAYNLRNIKHINNNTIVTSYNRVLISKYGNMLSWDTATFSVADISGIGYTGSQYVLSSGTTLLYSNDLVRWTTKTVATSVNALTANNSNIGTAKVKPITVACSDSTYNTLAYSYDGIQWYGHGNSILATRANYAAFNGYLWVAVGKGSNSWYATSTDGVRWTDYSNSIFTEAYQVAWNGSAWVAVGVGDAYSIAYSFDGITWLGVEGSKAIFTVEGRSVAWTGTQWLAYGSSTGPTSAYSPNTLGETWYSSTYAASPVTDISSVLYAYTSASSSTNQNGTYVAANAFDISSVTSWRSETSQYSSTGEYIGTNSTIVQGVGNISGDWLQIGLNATYPIRHYSISVGVTDISKCPLSWSLVASLDGSSWTHVETQTLSIPSSLTNNTYTLFFTASDTYASAHQYYRFVFQNTMGSDQVQINDIDLFTENPTHTLRPGLNISATKNWIQTSVSTGYSNIIQYKTLQNVPIKNRMVGTRYLGQISTSVSTSANAFVPSSYSYNGEYSVITDFSNGNIFYAKDFSNNSFQTVNTSTMINKYASCYNGTFFIAGGDGTDKILYSHPSDMSSWYSTANANTIFSGGAVRGLFSNSGFGFVSPPNSIHMIPGEKLSITAPKAYDHNMQGKGVAFSFSLE